MNPHTLFRNQLEVHLNRERNLPLLCKIITETVSPALSLCCLPPTPHRGMSMLQRNAIHQTFAIRGEPVPQDVGADALGQ